MAGGGRRRGPGCPARLAVGCGAVVRRGAAAIRGAGRRGAAGAGGALLYDADGQIELWGRYLAEELPRIYAEESAAVVVFVSAEYADRDWTRLGRRAALDRAVRERRIVLPARFDDTPLPGLLAGLVAVDLRGRSPQEFATWWRPSSPPWPLPRRAGGHRGHPPAPVLPSRLVRTLTGHTGWVTGVAFSPDGRLLAPPASDRTARVWDPATGEHLRTLTGHDDKGSTGGVSPDGRLLATASVDGTARLWDPATGEQLRTLTGHDDYVYGVAFSPDGRLLATASADKTARLWG